eukprot:TRINITY_DN12233_c0_g1_i2.p1 TRINITY_DN12233_c0_g1~~TRINITY_DN12233_c0_g1_i2.p1  ORF type:complete len:515 (+),score=90.24 TRINITY_DN12233_c0_g1_i2:52-1545(+)
MYRGPHEGGDGEGWYDQGHQGHYEYEGGTSSYQGYGYEGGYERQQYGYDQQYEEERGYGGWEARHEGYQEPSTQYPQYQYQNQSGQGYGEYKGAPVQRSRGYGSGPTPRERERDHPTRYQNTHRYPDDWDDDKKEYPFYCEPCDKGFYTNKRYLEHCEEHIYCPEPGCNFLCRKDYKLELHKILLHDRNNVNLEDTQAYLEARKKRFPTRERVQEARKIEALKKERGELIEKELRKRDGNTPGGGKGTKGGKKGGARGEHHSRPPLYYKCRKCGKPGHWTEYCWSEGPSVTGMKRPRSESPDDGPPEETDARQPVVSTDTYDAAQKNTQEEAEAEAPAPVTKEELRTYRLNQELVRRKRRRPTFWDKLVKSEVLKEKSMVLQVLRYFVLTDFLTKEMDWVAFVAHTMKEEEMLSVEDAKPAAVRTVVGAPLAVPIPRRATADDPQPESDEEESTDESSSSSGEEAAVSKAVLAELEAARQRVLELERQLKEKSAKKG